MNLNSLRQLLIERLNDSRHSLNRLCRSNDILPLLIEHTKFLPEKSKLNVMAWHIINEATSIPLCKKCQSRQTKFNNNKWGYLDFCSVKCSANSVQTIKKQQNTLKEKYGNSSIINAFQADSVKAKIQQTCIDRYGVDHNFKSSQVKEKTKSSILAKYGVEHYSQTNEFKEKYTLSIKTKYDVTHYSKTQEFKDKFKNTSLARYGVSNPMQCLEIFEKQQHNSYYYKDYILPSGKTIRIQGYENLALSEILTKYDESDLVISNHDIFAKLGKFEYFDGLKIRRYFPDIYIIPENKIIEVKSTRTYQINLQVNKLKRASVLTRKFAFEFWIYGKTKEVI
jgi:hypothetical protein